METFAAVMAAYVLIGVGFLFVIMQFYIDPHIPLWKVICGSIFLWPLLLPVFLFAAYCDWRRSRQRS